MLISDFNSNRLFLCKRPKPVSSAASGILLNKCSDHEPYFMCQNQHEIHKPQK